MARKVKKLPIGTVCVDVRKPIKTGFWRYSRPVLLKESCKSCGICASYCPENAIEKEVNVYEVNYDYCKGCGICASECPSKSIIMMEELGL